MVQLLRATRHGGHLRFFSGRCSLASYTQSPLQLSRRGADEIPVLPETQVRSAQFASGFSLPMPKTLNEIMKLESVEGLPAREVAQIWNDYHIGRGHISAVMSRDLYELFRQRAQTCPMFVLPVPKTNGFVTMLAQAQIPHLLFTGLEDYKVRGPGAAPFFAVTHYLELAESKGLVLVRGDVVLPGQLSDDEARGLLKNTHASYLEDRKFRHVQAFNKDGQSFDFRAMLREMGVMGG